MSVLFGWSARTAVVVGLLAVTACGKSTVAGDVDAGIDGAVPLPPPDGAVPVPEPDYSDELFKPNEVLEIAIQMDPSDWDLLRYQERNVFDIVTGADCQAAPYPSPYDYFTANVTVAGQLVENVGIRKKGFIGSSNSQKPSLKINTDIFVPGQKVLSVEDITLQCGRQGFAGQYLLITQCLGYELFRAAGLAASRCNFAHVTVNDQDLGIYAHVERVKKPMLSRNYDDGAGNLWEGTLSDFRDGWLGTFEQKTNEATLTKEPLQALADTLALPDDELSLALDSVLDVEQYLTFWAMEVITGHWDGYAGNTNNFFVYEDPVSGLLSFIPWGIDNLFSAASSLALGNSLLSRRLYELPSMRALYVAKVTELLDTVWKEAELLAEIDRMEALLTPFIDDPATVANEVTAFVAANDSFRTFISNRRAALQPQLAAPPALDGSLADDRCVEANGTFTATFSTTWGPFGVDPLVNGSSAEPSVELDSVTYAVTGGGAKAGPVLNTYPWALRVVAVYGANSDQFGVTVYMRQDSVVTGVDLPIDWNERRAVYGFFGIAGGTVNFTAFNPTPGGTVSGTLTLSLYQ